MILIISGTNRLNSNSLRLAKYYEKELRSAGQDCEILSLTELPATVIMTDLYGKRSDEFAVLQEKVSSSQKYIFIAPEYNGSFPGVLKLFIDACTYPTTFANKKVALVGISAGRYGNIRGIDHLTGVCHYMKMHVLPIKVHIPSIQQEISLEGELLQASTQKFIDEQIKELIRY